MQSRWLAAALTLTVVACTVSVNNQRPDNNQREDRDPTPTATARPPATSEPTPAPSAEPKPKMCTEMGCLNGLTVDLDVGKGGFGGKGSYVLDIEGDGKKAHCELRLPLPACDKGPAAKCTGDLKVDIAESGCKLPAKEHGFGPIRIQDAPAEVKVSLKRDGKKYGEASFSPAYKTLQPNGPDCQPVCKQGSEELCLGKCKD